MTFYEFKSKTLEGEDFDFASLQGKTVIVVNVASNYKQLVELYTKYHEHGLEIIAFPCNQFGGQEPGTPAEIREFVKGYGVEFTMMEKIDVKGKNQDPIYAWLTHEKKGILGTALIKWNFTKFIVDSKGTVLRRLGPNEEPNKGEPLIKELLGLGKE
eukprot:Clim_evm9s226 gene=Clim_evmTU9s226